MKMTCSFYIGFLPVELKIFKTHFCHFIDEILEDGAGNTSHDRHGVELEQALQLLLSTLLPKGCQNTFELMQETVNAPNSATVMCSSYLTPFKIIL